MNELSAHELFDAIAREQQMFDYAIERCEQATTNTGRVEATTSALDHAFAALELIGRLRVEEPEAAESLARTWRQVVLDVHRAERTIVEAAASR